MEYDGIVIGLMIRHDARWSYVREGRNTAHLVTPEADKDQYFLLSPNLDVTERSSSPSARDLRKCIKSTKSPGELLAVLKHAAEEVAVEQDTLGTAMQTCGHRMWWDALLEVFEMKNKLRLQIRYTSIVFNALACCLRCDAERVSACQLLQRKEIAVDLAKKAPCIEKERHGFTDCALVLVQVNK